MSKRLTKFYIRFRGPHSALLFKALHFPEPDHDTEVIGTGESKAVALARAVAHLRAEGYGDCMDQIQDQIDHQMPAEPHAVEGDELCSVYCIIGVSAE